jgi:hypothetical protein
VLTIRKADPSDYEFVLDCIRSFHKECVDEFGIPCNETAALDCMKDYVATSFIAVEDEKRIGVIAGRDAQYPANYGKIYQEAFWYVVPGRRHMGPMLLKVLEDYCKENNYIAIVMAHMANYKAESFAEFYKNNHYVELERHYIKRLK